MTWLIVIPSGIGGRHGGPTVQTCEGDFVLARDAAQALAGLYGVTILLGKHQGRWACFGQYVARRAPKSNARSPEVAHHG